MSEWRTGREDGGGRTLDGGALATLALTKEKDFDLLPPLVALSLEHLVNIIAEFLCLLFGPESLFAVCSRLVRGREKGGGEGIRLLYVALMWEMNVVEGELVLGGGQRGGDVEEGYYVNVPWSSPRSSQTMIELSDGRSVEDS